MTDDLTAKSPVQVQFCRRRPEHPMSVWFGPPVQLGIRAAYRWCVRLPDRNTDAQRDSEESYAAILDGLRWLGLNWDEGRRSAVRTVPYRQSQRTAELYHDVSQAGGCRRGVPGVLHRGRGRARHLAAGRNPKLGYDNFDRTLTPRISARHSGGGPKAGAAGLRMPDGDLSWNDLVAERRLSRGHGSGLRADARHRRAAVRWSTRSTTR